MYLLSVTAFWGQKGNFSSCRNTSILNLTENCNQKLVYFNSTNPNTSIFHRFFLCSHIKPLNPAVLSNHSQKQMNEKEIISNHFHSYPLTEGNSNLTASVNGQTISCAFKQKVNWDMVEHALTLGLSENKVVLPASRTLASAFSLSEAGSCQQVTFPRLNWSSGDIKE